MGAAPVVWNILHPRGPYACAFMRRHKITTVTLVVAFLYHAFTE